MENKYPHLNKFSKSIGLSPEVLVKAFQIEKEFHAKILKENSFIKRKELYDWVYKTVHPIYGKSETDISQSYQNPKNRVVKLFAKELAGKSVLDVGCGEGYFLAGIAKNLAHKKLTGIDVSIPTLSRDFPGIDFIVGNIIDFNLDDKFDVVFSDHVIEHIAPNDLVMHLKSVKSSLKKGGLFILNMPNRLFGPSDVTRIIDYTYTGKTVANGTHVNESTYSEMIPALEKCGFNDFKTVCPIPRLKFWLNNWRLSPKLLAFIENTPLFMKLLHSIKYRGLCIARFDVILICRNG